MPPIIKERGFMYRDPKTYENWTRIEFSKTLTTEIHNWLENTMKHDFCYGARCIWIEDNDDAALFKLTWYS